MGSFLLPLARLIFSKLLLASFLICASSPAFSVGGDENKFTLNARPSFETIPEDKKTVYETAQAHGYCSQVLEIEQEGLVLSRPEFSDRFAVGATRKKVDQTALEIYALGYRRCQALKHLSRVLAVPKLKAGIAPYAPLKAGPSKTIKNTDTRFTHFAPKPRLGIFFKENSQALNKLIEDRTRPKGLDRPIDWEKSQMPLDEEILLHTAFTDLAILAICHSYPEAYKDLGKFYDVRFSVIDPFINYGLFRQALYLDIEAKEMKARLAEVSLALPPSVIQELDQQSSKNQLYKHPRLARLFKLCQSY
ncbi:MAG: hypothetical protein ACRBBJ_03485 [Rhodomicrobiaceae bacterium]